MCFIHRPFLLLRLKQRPNKLWAEDNDATRSLGSLLACDAATPKKPVWSLRTSQSVWHSTTEKQRLNNDAKEDLSDSQMYDGETGSNLDMMLVVSQY